MFDGILRKLELSLPILIVSQKTPIIEQLLADSSGFTQSACSKEGIIFWTNEFFLSALFFWYQHLYQL